MTTQTANAAKNCPHCGMFHTTTCPTIKAIEYHTDGSVKRVEFKTANDYPPPVTGPTTNPSPTPWPYTATMYGASGLANACEQDEGA